MVLGTGHTLRAGRMTALGRLTPAGTPGEADFAKVAICASQQLVPGEAFGALGHSVAFAAYLKNG